MPRGSLSLPNSMCTWEDLTPSWFYSLLGNAIFSCIGQMSETFLWWVNAEIPLDLTGKSN